ncbi:MAG: hypothetical protein HDT39_10300 [Lachnospiraceae bacterium]|nr:hypothetical protein [Lachnospiraceae bacterium]
MKDFGKGIYIIIGLAAILVSYFLGFNNLSSKNTELQQTVDELQADYERLKADYANKSLYIKETKEFGEKYEEILSKFDTTLLNEGQIMDIYDMQTKCGIEVTAVTLTDPSEIYAFDGSVTSDFVIKAQTPQVNSDGTTVEPESIVKSTAIDSSYRGVSSTIALTAKGSYEGIKEMLKTITSDKKRKVPSNIVFTFDSTTEEIICGVTIAEYAIKGKDRVEKKVEIPDGAIGRENIFFDPLAAVNQAP